MKNFKILFVLSMLAVILFPQAAPAIGLEAAAGAWVESPGGDMAYKGNALSVDDDLNYANKARFYGRVKIDMPLIIPNIYLMATPMSFDGAGNKSAGFTFGDKTYTASVPFTSELRLDQYDIGLYYGVPFLKTATLGKLNIDAGLNIRIIDFSAEVTQGALKESANLTFPVPMVYIGAQVDLIKKLAIEAEFRGIAYDTNHYYDLIGRVKYKFLGLMFIGAGYRYEDIKIDKSSIVANLNFSGPFAEAGVEF
ncbi:MAG: TIGR04219 family outer membrane beta-barrel protein [Nitrospirae bacterium]|nr:TIGR04219 family outer membrane beta-barrel protein [Nitrospirota bacterium]MBI4839228.1 TIGR04219 family outer membrane beta-barrel protein [Nitrospirota bacterium]